MSSKLLLSKNVSVWESTWMYYSVLLLKWMEITVVIGLYLNISLHKIVFFAFFVFKQTHRTVFICSPLALIASICRTVVRHSQNTCMYIYTPACVWHILTMKRTSLGSPFWVFHKLITSRQQQGKCDSSLSQTVSAVVVIIGVSESVKDHKQRVWTGSSWFMSRAGKQHNFVDLCTLRTQKRPNVKHMAAAWSVDDSIQHVEKKNISEVALALFFFPSLLLKFPQTFICLCTCRLMFSVQVWDILALHRINCAFEATAEPAENSVTAHSLLQNMEKGWQHSLCAGFSMELMIQQWKTLLKM